MIHFGVRAVQTLGELWEVGSYIFSYIGCVCLIDYCVSLVWLIWLVKITILRDKVSRVSNKGAHSWLNIRLFSVLILNIFIGEWVDDNHMIMQYVLDGYFHFVSILTINICLILMFEISLHRMLCHRCRSCLFGLIVLYQ